MSCGSINCRRGDPCLFVVRVRTGIDARYTRARFQARTAWDPQSELLLSATETDGIAISTADGTVTVAIGATKTAALPNDPNGRQVAAQLRLYADNDLDDCMSFPIPFQILPEVISGGA